MAVVQARKQGWKNRRRNGNPPAAFGAVDLGTNNCRLLVARPDGDGFRVIDSFSRIVRLGEGLGETGNLGEEAIERTLKALKVCAGKMRSHGVRLMRNVATEACRRAANGADFVKRVKTETGLDLEPISYEEEARLTLTGCSPLLEPGPDHALVFDIGGGSTELMWTTRSPQDGSPQLTGLLSIPRGVVCLTDEYGSGAIDPADYAAIVDWFSRKLDELDGEHGISDAISGGGVQMLGSSGTVTTLAGVHLDLPRYERAKVDGLDIGFKDIETVCARFAGMDYESRAAHPCIGRDRADLVVAGFAILEAVCRKWPVGKLRVADRGIREGLLIGLMTAADAGQGDAYKAAANS